MFLLCFHSILPQTPFWHSPTLVFPPKTGADFVSTGAVFLSTGSENPPFRQGVLMYALDIYKKYFFTPECDFYALELNACEGLMLKY